MASENQKTSQLVSDGGAEMERSQVASDTVRKENIDVNDSTVSSVDGINSTVKTETIVAKASDTQDNIPAVNESNLMNTHGDDAADGDNKPTKLESVSELTSSESYQPDLAVALPPLQPFTTESVETQPNQVELPNIDQSKESSTPAQISETKDNISGGAELSPCGGAELSPCEGAEASSKSSSSLGQCVYYIKWIHYNQNKVPIITQNENGPCPLLSILNVLLLREKVKLAPMVEMVTSEQLMTYLGDCILDSMPDNLSESVRANYEQNMQDAMAVMYKLQTGLDVNVKFTGISDFEYTPECIMFDLLEIPLYHGWLVDPQDPVCSSAVGTCSYNQLVEKIISQKGSDKEEAVMEALIVEQFLERTASQLTYYGLCELTTSIKESELCVFFRNNHFSTLYRFNNELFILVTDQGFLTESNVVWETLSNVEGDCHFVDTNFRTYTKPEPSGSLIPSPVAVGTDMQIDQDYQVALSLQKEAELREEPERNWNQFPQESSSLQMADHELALRLQEEEDRRAAAAVNASQQRTAQQQQQNQGQGGQPGASHSSGQSRERHREEKKNKDCQIL